MHTERIKTAILLLLPTLVAYLNYTFFISFMSITFTLSIQELINYKHIYSNIIAIVQIYCYNLILRNAKNFEHTMFIIIYNSVSDIIQYFGGKYVGKTKIFSFTSKTLEGYLIGILLTHLLFYQASNIYMIKLNFIGILGGIISSLVKRSLKIKHWSLFLGEHGGINDRLDSIVLPLIYNYLVTP